MCGVFFGAFPAYVWRIFLAYLSAYSLAYLFGEPRRISRRIFGEVALLKTCASTLGVFFRRIFVADPSLFCKHLRTKKSQEKAGGCGTRFGRRPGDGVATPQRGAGVLGPPGAAAGPGDAGGLRGPPMGPPRDRRGAAERHWLQAQNQAPKPAP